jgi:hypothetical protein
MFSFSNSIASSRKSSFLKSRSLNNENKLGHAKENFEMNMQIDVTTGIFLLISTNGLSKVIVDTGNHVMTKQAKRRIVLKKIFSYLNLQN